MVFGDIIEPTTRSLWDNDYDEYPEPKLSKYDWNGIKEVPEQIDKLIIADTLLVITVLKELFVTSQNLVCRVENIKLCIYKVSDNNYLVSYENKECNGLVVEEICKWIQQSKQVYVLTSTPLALYQGTNNEVDNIYFLSTMKNIAQIGMYKKLNVPNLVTGFGASVFSYCKHIAKDCTLFNNYVSYAPIDTITAKPLVSLLKLLQIGNLLPFKSIKSIADHNLYM